MKKHFDNYKISFIEGLREYIFELGDENGWQWSEKPYHHFHSYNYLFNQNRETEN